MLAWMVWGAYAMTIEFIYAFACVTEGVKACQYALWHFEWYIICTVNTVILRICSNLPEKSARCPAECGGGVQSLFGQCSNNLAMGLS